MSNKKRGKRTLILLLVVLYIVLIAGFTLARYATDWTLDFGLNISPLEGEIINPFARKYFRSNELKPENDDARYEINGTYGWFTVANGLDSSTFSEIKVKYTLKWYISKDGSTWKDYGTQNVECDENIYDVDKYKFAPVTVDGVVYNYIKVVASTSSIKQKDIQAIYHFNYSDAEIDYSYANGVIYVNIDTNDMAGDYKFSWVAGIAPDNSDPTGKFASAMVGPSEITVELGHNTGYEFLFFVTDSQLNTDASNLYNLVSIEKITAQEGGED